MPDCQLKLKAANKAYPRTCALCGLGKCQKGLEIGVRAVTSAGNVESPMGWFYNVEQTRAEGQSPTVYRCKLGSSWERMEIYDIGELSGPELRFIADLIDASKASVAA